MTYGRMLQMCCTHSGGEIPIKSPRFVVWRYSLILLDIFANQSHFETVRTMAYLNSANYSKSTFRGGRLRLQDFVVFGVLVISAMSVLGNFTPRSKSRGWSPQAT
jgi:hypothetical protein